ncbi:TRAP transporter large permease subunit [Motiliproteus sp. MSK22-1]|uniref:TRAP transporter large permease n=1 Tax=Motiliproteus sp. MSK22-1 TaxID=1897630 RepID=UPI000976567E|nr:TRAP transporter large permease subunit [Motiliproteus sp. MSK22-1]OMH36224.1 tripartite transporter [Motiliproteus sp. MSK22-1]
MSQEVVLLILLFTALAFSLMLGFPVAFTLAGSSLIVALVAEYSGYFDISLLTALPQRVFSIMINEILLSIPLFVFMGIMLERAKIAEDLLDTMGRLLRHLPGGLAVAVTVVGALLAASTGIVGATVATMGLLSLPVMLRWGYDPKLAAGSICASGTLGQIIPPSIVLVLLGDVISSAYQRAQMDQGIFAPDTVSVGDLFAGALLPGILLVALYIVYQIIFAIRNPHLAPSKASAEGSDLSDVPTIVETLQALVPPLGLVIAVLGSILAGLATPTEAAAVGATGACFLAAIKQNSSLRPWLYASLISLLVIFVLSGQVNLSFAREVRSSVELFSMILAVALTLFFLAGFSVSLITIYRGNTLVNVCRSTMNLAAMIFSILLGATLFSLIFRGLGGDELVHGWLHDLPGGVYGAFLVVMVIMFLMGFFLDFIEITFVVVPVVAPTLLMQGLDPVWLGVMIAMNLQTSFLTPPFGFALFYLRGVAPPEITTVGIYKGVIPFIFVQLIAMIVLTLFPSIVTWLPEVIYG